MGAVVGLWCPRISAFWLCEQKANVDEIKSHRYPRDRLRALPVRDARRSAAGRSVAGLPEQFELLAADVDHAGQRQEPDDGMDVQLRSGLITGWFSRPRLSLRGAAAPDWRRDVLLDAR